MKGNISSKKKIVIAASVVGVVLLAAIISVVAVLAAPAQVVSSSVTVTYRVNDVYATTTARYTEAAVTVSGTDVTVGDLISPIKTLGGKTFLADGTSTGAVDAATVELNSTTKRAVIFEYNFQNDGANTFTIELSSEATAVNMKVLYASTTGVAATDAWAGLTWSETKPAALTAAAANSEVGNATDEVHIYILAYVDNLSKGASFTGNVEWTLTSIEQAA